ncbi:MAG: ATPase [Roseovarius sp.]|nr:ATPase [Roseovarius sp.]
MGAWKSKKRFWKTASARQDERGCSVYLDSRQLMTPAKSALVLPTFDMAEAIADEWNAQDGEIKSETMPVTRSANAAIDKVAPMHDEVVEHVSAYGDSDLICYRAREPAHLARLQSEAWDPLIDWAETSLGAGLRTICGMIHEPQDGKALTALKKRVREMDPFALMGFHELVSLSGSLIIGFATVEGPHPPSHYWKLSRVDEMFQISQWGEDEEEARIAMLQEAAFIAAKRFHDLATADKAG